MNNLSNLILSWLRKSKK